MICQSANPCDSSSVIKCDPPIILIRGLGHIQWLQGNFTQLLKKTKFSGWKIPSWWKWKCWEIMESINELKEEWRIKELFLNWWTKPKPVFVLTFFISLCNWGYLNDKNHLISLGVLQGLKMKNKPHIRSSWPFLSTFDTPQPICRVAYEKVVKRGGAPPPFLPKCMERQPA